MSSLPGTIDATASELQGLQLQHQATANNLANISTAGYKRRVTGFSQALGQQMAASGWSKELGSTITAPGVNGAELTTENHSLTSQTPLLASTQIDFSQGDLSPTGRPLDVGISGEGFFVLETPAGRVFTRNGSFRVNPNGQLVDEANRLVAGQSGPIVVPPDTPDSQVHVSEDGSIQAAGRTVGKLLVVALDDTSVLSPVGDCCYLPPEDVETRNPEDATIVQGSLEQSNVRPMEELVNLIHVTRLYEANMKFLRIQDEQGKSLLQVAMS